MSKGLVVLAGAAAAALGAVLAVLVGVSPRTGSAGQEEPVRLVVWDRFAGAEAEAAQRVYDTFVAAHPDLVLERRALSVAEAEPAALATRLASGTGPDVIAYDVGTGFRDRLANPNLLLPLNELPVRYGWTTRLDDAAERWAGRAGQLYALPVRLDLLGLYVNRAALDEAWLAMPDTAAELLEFCRQAGAKGLVPIAVGADPATGMSDLFAMALNNLLGPDLTGNLLFTDWGNWETVRVARAARLVFVEMPDAGCYGGAAGAGRDPAALFAEGRALFLPAGSGRLAEVEASRPAGGVGFVPFPAVDGGRGRVVPTAVGAAYALAAKSAHPREAAMLLDFVLSDEAVRIWVEVGGMAPPVAFDVGGWQISPLRGTVLDLAAEAREQPFWRAARAELGFTLAPAAPQGFAAALDDGFRAMLAGERTPEQFAADLQLAWEAERSGI